MKPQSPRVAGNIHTNEAKNKSVYSKTVAGDNDNNEGTDDSSEDEDAPEGGALLASKLDKLNEEYLQREEDIYRSVVESTKRVEIQDVNSPRIVQTSPRNRRMSLADMMNNANFARKLQRQQTMIRAAMRLKLKKNVSKPRYIYFEGKLMKFEDVPEHLRDFIPKVK